MAEAVLQAHTGRGRQPASVSWVVGQRRARRGRGMYTHTLWGLVRARAAGSRPRHGLAKPGARVHRDGADSDLTRRTCYSTRS